MKKTILWSMIILLAFMGILLFPSESKTLASQGLMIWYQNMIPALFPIMILSQMLILTDSTNIITKIVHPLLKVTFHLNEYMEYAICIGFLCGFPLGASIVFNLQKQGKISYKEAEFLLCFCNNIGPIYMLSCVLPNYETLQSIHIMIGMYLIPLLYGIVLRYTLYRSSLCGLSIDQTKYCSIPLTTLQAFEKSLNDSVSAMIKLGAIIVFFTTVKLIPLYMCSSLYLLKVITALIFEINGGLFYLYNLPSDYKMLLLCFLQFGGLSCLFQVKSISIEGFSMNRYAIHKLIQTSLMFFYLLIFSLFN